MPAEQILHASAVALDNRALLITGKSGSGKSTLAIQLMALGARLVSDDRVCVTALPDGALHLSAPDAIAGVIEARGLGLIHVDAAPATAVAVIEMDETATARLPEPRDIVIEGITLPAFARVESPAFPAMLIAYLKGGLAAP